MVAMLENILDPQTVILGGALPDAIIDEIIARMGASADFGCKPAAARPAARHPRQDGPVDGGAWRGRPAAFRQP